MIILEQFKMLLPLAYAWVEEHEQIKLRGEDRSRV